MLVSQVASSLGKETQARSSRLSFGQPLLRLPNRRIPFWHLLLPKGKPGVWCTSHVVATHIWSWVMSILVIQYRFSKPNLSLSLFPYIYIYIVHKNASETGTWWWWCWLFPLAEALRSNLCIPFSLLTCGLVVGARMPMGSSYHTHQCAVLKSWLVIRQARHMLVMLLLSVHQFKKFYETLACSHFFCEDLVSICRWGHSLCHPDVFVFEAGNLLQTFRRTQTESMDLTKWDIMVSHLLLLTGGSLSRGVRPFEVLQLESLSLGQLRGLWISNGVLLFRWWKSYCTWYHKSLYPWAPELNLLHVCRLLQT